MTGWYLAKCEDAWANYFSGSITSASVNVYRGNDEMVKGGNVIVCFGEDGAEEQQGSGIYRVSMLLHLAVPYAGSGSVDTRNEIDHQFNERTFNNANLINDLTGNTNNLAIIAIENPRTNNTFEGDCWVSNTLIEMIVVQTQ